MATIAAIYFGLFAFFGVTFGWKTSRELGGWAWHVGDAIFYGIFPGIGVLVLIALIVKFSS